ARVTLVPQRLCEMKTCQRRHPPQVPPSGRSRHPIACCAGQVREFQLEFHVLCVALPKLGSFASGDGELLQRAPRAQQQGGLAGTQAENPVRECLLQCRERRLPGARGRSEPGMLNPPVEVAAMGACILVERVLRAGEVSLFTQSPGQQELLDWLTTLSVCR